MKKLFTILFLIYAAIIVAQPSGWLYNLPIQVQNSNTVNAVNYQLKIVVNTQSLITAGQMNSNGSDIRFSGACTSNTFYNYWIEGGLNTPTTAIWVKIPLIAANTSSTVFMFYGNASAIAASAIVGTFRGPNSGTDSVTGGTSGGLTVCQRGFRFQPYQNLLVTHFGKYEPTGSTRYVTLFNYTSTAIMSQTQVSGPSATYSYGAISNPLWLNAGSQYVLQIYGLATDGYYYGTSSQIGQHLMYIDMQYSNGGTQNTFPTNTLANYHYGYGDFWYFICSTLAITPSYSVGQSNVAITSPSNAIAVCAGGSMTLSTNASGSYTWSNGSQSSSIVVTPNTTTTYSVAQTSSTGCTSNAYFTLNVSAGTPTLAIVSSTNSTCLGKTATLTATGALTYSWSNGVVNGISFTPSVTNVYTVTGQNGCGTATAVTTISISPIAVTMLASPTVVCAGLTSTITTVAAANSYTWYPVTSGASSIVVSPITNMVYTIAVSDGTCSGSGTVAISALPVPTIAITPSVTSNLCSGLPITLTASGGVNYTWTPGSLNGSVITVTPAAPQAYQVIGSNSVGCTSVANAAVITTASPTITLVANNNLICAGDPVDIIASGANSYVWSNSSTNSSITVNPMSSSVYTVTGTTNSCSSTQTVSITVFIPTLIVSGNTSICSGQTATLTASGANTYAWNNGFTTSNILVSPAVNTIYSLTALTNSSGINCPSSGSIQVTIKPNPTVTATASRTNMCKGENNTLSAAGANTYSWNTGANTASFVITPSLVTITNYSVIGTGTNACTNTTSIQIKINSCVSLSHLSSNNNSDIVIYPNPNHGEFKILSQQVLELKLINELGQLIQRIKLDYNNNFEIDIRGLSNGIYFITGNDQGVEVNQKIVITN